MINIFVNILIKIYKLWLAFSQNNYFRCTTLLINLISHVIMHINSSFFLSICIIDISIYLSFLYSLNLIFTLVIDNIVVYKCIYFCVKVSYTMGNYIAYIQKIKR